MKKIRFIDLFAGIGGMRIPFDELNYECVFSSEWNDSAKKTYEANFGESPFGDITRISAESIPEHDLLLAGFPCQSFSIMGRQRGFRDTRGTLFFEIERILKYHKPSIVLLENVKNLVSHDNGNTFSVICEHLKDLGYYIKWQVLNALDFGLPQKRERTFIVGFRSFEEYYQFNFLHSPIPYNLNDILEDDKQIDTSLMASEYIKDKRNVATANKELFYPSIWHENKSGNISILPYSSALRSGGSYNYILVNGVRRPSSRELLRLQGFPETFKIVVPHGEIRKQTGNAVAIPVIRFLANKINDIIIYRKYNYGETKVARQNEFASQGTVSY